MLNTLNITRIIVYVNENASRAIQDTRNVLSVLKETIQVCFSKLTHSNLHRWQLPGAGLGDSDSVLCGG
jgi:hypothetical protein